ncbi:hypothetical protein JA9_001989 [Meyerozyma sp. JA9]|nr:hypothetical protein JA9_001989 [Meyerozyma sp. JA9]
MNPSPSQIARQRATAYRRPVHNDHRKRARREAQEARHRTQLARIDLVREKQAELQATGDIHRRAARDASWESDLDALLEEEQRILEEMQQSELEALQLEESSADPSLQYGSQTSMPRFEQALDGPRAQNQTAPIPSQKYDDDDWDLGNDTIECILAAEAKQTQPHDWN